MICVLSKKKTMSTKNMSHLDKCHFKNISSQKYMSTYKKYDPVIIRACTHPLV